MTTQPPRPPHPGHPDAVKQGCICRAADNRHTLGRNRFWVAAECPLHGINTVTRQERP